MWWWLKILRSFKPQGSYVEGTVPGDFAETTITGVNKQPAYIVEHLKTVISDADALNLDNIGQDTGSGITQIFRVTSRGFGGTGTAQVLIQGTYGKRL